MKKLTLAFLFTIVCIGGAFAQETETNNKTIDMNLKTYVIERQIPGAGNLTAEELKGISQASCSVLEEMGPTIQWQHSYVTGDKVFCVYKAANEELVKEHARRGGFPANAITEVATIISPATAKN